MPCRAAPRRAEHAPRLAEHALLLPIHGAPRGLLLERVQPALERRDTPASTGTQRVRVICIT